MAQEEATVERLAFAKRLALAVDVLGWTLDTLPSPIASSDARNVLTAGLEACRTSVAQGEEAADLADDLVAQLEEVEQENAEPGIAHFLAALLVFHYVDGPLNAQQTVGILSYCYEGALERENPPRWTPEHEWQISRLLSVIVYQKDAIFRFSAMG
jgi:hypothetical protein